MTTPVTVLFWALEEMTIKSPHNVGRKFLIIFHLRDMWVENGLRVVEQLPEELVLIASVNF
ncbi:MAG TPA: hypothetical protein VIH22_01110 [Cyclobacteriaceae bacterium]